MQTISANRAAIPSLGFGTFRMEGKDVLRMGFRHVDTAQIYRNEAEVGEAIATSGVSRAEVFLITKVWIDNLAPDRFIASVDESLAKLRTDMSTFCCCLAQRHGAVGRPDRRAERSARCRQGAPYRRKQLHHRPTRADPRSEHRTTRDQPGRVPSPS